MPESFVWTNAPASCGPRLTRGVIMTNFLKTFISDESGASAAEYALILAVVGVAIGAGALALGTNIGASITNASNTVKDCGTKAAAATAVGGTTYVAPAAC